MNEKQLFVGNIDYSISMLICEAFELGTRYPYAIISTIDSNRNLKELKICQEILKMDWTCETISEQLSILTAELIKINQKLDLFNGFDEIWLFSKVPQSPIPEDFWITGPRDISSDTPEGLLEWMEANHCILGLGDGIGLNYVTVEKNTKEYIRKTLRDHSR